MKRFLFILICLSCLIGLLCFNGFAVNENVVDPVEDGKLYGKILHWQDYVTSSVQSGTLPNWNTRVNLPSDSFWVHHPQQGIGGDLYYTNTAEITLPIRQNRGLVTWTQPYFISIEDIRAEDFNKLGFDIETNLTFDVLYVYIEYYDQYKNIIRSQIVLNEQVGSNVFSRDVTWQYQPWEGTHYIRFYVEMSFREEMSDYLYSDLEIYRHDWYLSLPYEYDPVRFAVDGIDAWMNGYFKPLLPETGEGGIWERFEANQVNLQEIFATVRNAFSYYSRVFRDVWGYLFTQFLSIQWVAQLFYSSVLIGSIAFFFGITMEAVGKISKSDKRSNERIKNINKHGIFDKKSSKKGAKE